LGFLYQNGFGVPLNYAEAYKWFTLAANSERAASRRALKALTQIMTTTQSRDGQARISEWMSRHNNLELAAQKPEAKELDSFATAAQP
jgi:TPR repeat protein